MIGAIIQARMTSTRLPGKVLMPIKGKPILDYLFRQLEPVAKLDIIILATTTNASDDPLVEYAKIKGIECFRGSEPDVLERYYLAAKKFSLDHIMRLTADCPLLDPKVCNMVIDRYLKEGVDYVHTGSTFAEGLDSEIFSFEILEQAYKEAKLKSEREHITMYFHNNPMLFSKITLLNKTDDSKYRFTIDEPNDFAAINAIIEALDQGNPIDSEKVILFLKNHPKIFNLNSKIIRNEGLIKSVANDHKVN